MPVGARIRSCFPRPDAELVAAFQGLASCDVSDAVGRLTVADPAIKWVGGGRQLAGPALTVLCRPDDNLMIHAAIDRAQPGDVIVVAAGGGEVTALIGEMLTRWARERGVAGFVVYGPVRDVGAMALPVFARGTNPRAPFKVAPGEVGYPVGLGSVAVNPGDIIVADADGVVVVPLADAPAVLAKAQAIGRKDEQDRAAMAAGTYDRSWVGPALKAAGVEEEV